MITIKNKYKFGAFVEYREWQWMLQSYSYSKGHIVGINYIDIQKGPSIKYGIVEYQKWENKEEIEYYGVDNEYDYYMKYCVDKNNESNSFVTLTWVDEKDIIKIIK